GQPVEGVADAGHHAAVGEAPPAADAGDLAVAIDDEVHRHRASEARIAAEAALVTGAEPPMVHAHDALDDLRREAPAHGGRRGADGRRPGHVALREPAMSAAEAITAEAEAAPDGPDPAQADAAAITAAALADPG